MKEDDPIPPAGEVTLAPPTWRDVFSSEDWLANGLGAAVLIAFLFLVGNGIVTGEKALKTYLAKPAAWTDNPVEALTKSRETMTGVGRAFITALVLFGLGSAAAGVPLARFIPGFVAVFALAVFSFVLAQQQLIAAYNLEFALWAIFAGLLISNTIGTPRWVKPALRTEFFIKTGLVIYGADIMLNQLLALALPGIAVSWVVTPIVLVSTYIIGQRWIGIESRTLNITISADMSVCGVSAAIAAAAACRAKKEELSLAIGISLAFTAIMMVAQPAFIKAVGMDPVVGGAWIGGTIDSTGAVGAAGQVLGDQGRFMAITIKMIQNMLIGVIAFGVAVYWVTFVERDGRRSVGVIEVWRRFPKFILGFVAASIAFTALAASEGPWSKITGDSKELVKAARDWCFCLAFVSIGLETDFRQLGRYLKGGKPVTLYVVGQSINLALSLAMCWLMFKVVFPDFADTLAATAK